MTDGQNLTGFNDVKPVTNTSWNGEQYAADPASAFPSSDKSSQGNAGLNGEGSSSSLPISGADESDM
jgi:hypothetical protein